MKYQDIILEVFKTEDEVLYEWIMPSPFLAFSVFKDKVFKKANDSKNTIDDKVKTAAREVKAKGQVFKEKARAEVGKTTGDTVYKLTPEQKEVIKEMYAKYGYDLIKDINTFRRNVLAPYNLLKRYVKENQTVSSKDITGMTKEQFLSALESGRKKIEARGDAYKEKSKELQRKVQKYSEELSSYKKAIKAIKSGNVDNNILNKLYKELELSDKDLEGYSLEELRTISNRIKENAVKLRKINDKKDISSDDFETAAELRKKQRELKSGKIDLTKSGEFKRKGSFDSALGKYFLRSEIKKGLVKDPNNPFIDTYISIINKLYEGVERRRKETLNTLISLKKSTEFNNKERKIWEKRPTVNFDSNKISDYYQKIKEEDFLDKPIRIEKNDKIIQTEKEIQKEIKKFEKELEKKMDPSDVKKLKQYRLINNPITVKEMKSPDKLFKSEEEIKKDITSVEKNKKENYLSQADFIRKIKEMATREYDSISELNKAKKEVDELVNTMKENGEDEAVEKVEDIIKKFKIRRELNKQDIIGHKTDEKELVSIKDIENKLQSMIKKNYEDFDEYKQDKELLDKMIKKYKEDEGEEAEDELDDIKYLFDRLENKMKRGI